MKPIVLAISLMALVGCIETEIPSGAGYLIVDNQTNEQISVIYKLVYFNTDTIKVCVLPQTKDTIYKVSGDICFNLGDLKTLRIATCDNPTHVLYIQEPINESQWIVDEQSPKDGFYCYSSNTFVVTDELLNQ